MSSSSKIICNGNRTKWSPIRSVIIRVINKTGRPRSGSAICLITSMIADRIGRHEVLLPINHNFNKICDIIGYFLNQNTRNSKFCFASSESWATRDFEEKQLLQMIAVFFIAEVNGPE